MATDSTYVSRTETSSNREDIDLTPEMVQLAQNTATQNAAPAAVIPAAPGGQVQVAFPEGQTVIRLQVGPGETIALPFDGSLAARFSEDGNLAVKLGDRTVILLGYAEANQEAGVTLTDAKGGTVDVASVVASTDPNLDIQTAAGGTAAGDTGPSGSAAFAPFGLSSGLGGFNAVDVLAETALTYRTILPDNNRETFNTAADNNAPGAINNGVTVTMPGVEGEGRSVDEAGLPTGSRHDGSNETSGTIQISAPDGVASIQIGDTVITAAQLAALGTTPITITTPEGNTLTLTGWNGSQLSYTYQQNVPTKGDETDQRFVVIVTDGNGDQGSGTLIIDIRDDAPTAHDDTDTVGAGGYEQSGNVITGSGTTSGETGKDVQGADGAKITGVSLVIGGETIGDPKPVTDGGVKIEGQYGTLTINPDGSYTYERHPNTPGGVSDQFSYRLTDGDGDSSNAKLTITIEDAAPTIGSETRTSVEEAGLPGGSDAPSSKEATKGAVSYGQGDGQAKVEITVGGKSYELSGTPKTITGDYGTLKAWLENGQIKYEYTLTKTTTGDNTHDDFGVVVTDKDGDKANGKLVVDIVDDQPQARDDSDTVKAGGDSASGNVITGEGTTSGSAGADTKGADGASITKIVGHNGASDTTFSGGHSGGYLEVAGKYGTLKIWADGSYTYERNANTPGGVTDEFTYTLTDRDGDSSTAKLTIEIKDAKPGIGGDCGNDLEAKVYEAGLPGGSDASSNKEITKGSISYSQGDGPATVAITVGGQSYTLGTKPQTITGDYGTLKAWLENGQIKYEYILTGKTNGDGLHDDFNIVVTDKDGDIANGELKIDIVDDAPKARDDSDVVEAGKYSESGNVITGSGTTSGSTGADTKGADGAKITGISLIGANGHAGPEIAVTDGGVKIKGQYGELTIKADGSYSYERYPDTPGGVSDQFSYKLTDGDGDSSSAKLTIEIKDAKPSIGDDCGNDLEARVHESGLPGGSEASTNKETTTGSISYSQGDGQAKVEITVGGQTLALGVTPQVIAGQYGTLKAWLENGQVKYEYTLTKTSSGDNTHDDFNIVVTDKDGDKASGKLVVDIVDDEPRARNDSDATESLNGERVAAGNVITGDGTTSGAAGADTKGADGASITKIVGQNGSDTTFSGPNGYLEVAGKYGTLKIWADGSYTYTAYKNGGYGVDSFTYKLTDKDGDSSTAKLDITVTNKKPTVDLTDCHDPNGSVQESGLDTGSNPSSTSKVTKGNIAYTEGDGSNTVTIKFGGAVITLGETAKTINGEYGTLKAWLENGQIKYEYTLTKNSSGDHTDENFTVTVRDADGDQASGTLIIDIVDDAPKARDDSDATESLGGDRVASGNVVTGEGTTSGSAGADTKGADGASITKIVSQNGSDTTFSGPNGYLEVTGKYGTLKIWADGSYTYTAYKNGGHGVDSFTYTLTDKDGDASTAKLDITVTNKKPTVDLTDCHDPNGSVQESGLNTGSNPSATSKVTTGSIAYAEGDGSNAVTIKFGGAVVTLGETAKTISGDYGTLKAWLENGQIKYEYTLTKNSSGDHTGENFIVSVTDADGDKASGTLIIDIVDDVPTALADSATVKPGKSITDNVLANDTQGADGAKVSQIQFGSKTYNVPEGGLTIGGKYGDLTIYPDGRYTYQADRNAKGVDTFTYTIQDRDGDTSSAKLTVTIGNKTPTLDLTDCHDANGSVQESGLDTGSNPSSTSKVTKGSIAYTEGDGSNPVEIKVGNSTLVLTGTKQSIKGDYGTLTAWIEGGQIKYEYTLTKRSSGDYNHDDFTISVRDADGDKASGTLIIDIVDDRPVAVADVNAVKPNQSVDGNVTDNDKPGADGITVTQIQFGNRSYEVSGWYGTTIAGRYGELTINADGSYSYKAYRNAKGTDTFTYTVKDGDGDRIAADLTIKVGNNVPAGELVVGMDVNDRQGNDPHRPDLFEHVVDTTPNPHIGEILGTDGADVLIGDASTGLSGEKADTINGGAGDDVIFGDSIAGGWKNFVDDHRGKSYAEMHDELYANHADYAQHTSGGTDIIKGGTGNDIIYGGGGDDRLYGDNGDHKTSGSQGDGNDTLFGGKGNDELYGEGGNDYLDGGDGDDKLFGGDGDDTLIYDAADSDVRGGSGFDTLIIRTNMDFDRAVGKVSSFERFDMTDGKQEVLGSKDSGKPLSASDVLSISGDNKTLQILGDHDGPSADKVFINKNDWTATGTQQSQDGHTFDVYTGHVNNNTVTLLIEHGLQVDRSGQ